MKTILIPHGTEPVERPAVMEDSKGDRTPGALRGEMHIAADFFEPLPPEELEPWE